MQLILASRSPRRIALLREAGYSFDIHPADIDESDVPASMLPSAVAQYLSRAKANKVSELFPEATVLAADTVVALGDWTLGKPADANEARKMLRLLSGTTQIVITGVSVVRAHPRFSEHRRVMSAVRMRPLSPQEIDDYVASGLWEGKAGGYGIQDDDPFVTRLTGCHTNVVGLPMTTTRNILQLAGIRPAGGAAGS
jgi:septum formation protein